MSRIPDFKKVPWKVYNPEYCDDLIKYMSKGLSNIQIAAKLGISEVTFYKWKDAHPDFAEAYDLGDPKRFDYLMEQADKAFLEEKNDKGYKHWKNKMSFIYKNYVPEAKMPTSTINIGNMNVLQQKSEQELLEIFSNKLNKNKDIIEAKLIDKKLDHE